MPRIAFVHSNNYDVGGADFMMLRIAGACCAHGYEPLVVLSIDTPIRHRYADLGVSVRQLRMPRLSRSRNPLYYLRWLVDVIVAAARLRPIFKRQHVDLVYANDLNELPALLAARMARLPSVARIQFNFDGPTILRRCYMGLIARLASRVLCVSESVRRLNFGSSRIAQRKTAALHNWYEPSGAPSPALAEPFARFGVPAGARVILMPARLEPWKGQHVLIEAAPRILQQVEDAVILLVGHEVRGARRQDYVECLRRRSQELGIAGRVFFHSHVDEIEPLIRSAALIVHCSVKPEPFGLTVLEALWHGVPLVAAKAGGPIEIVGDPPVAPLHEPGDAEQLARHVIERLTNQQRSSSLVAQGQERAQAFSKQTLWPRYQAVFDQLLTGPRQGI